MHRAALTVSILMPTGEESARARRVAHTCLCAVHRLSPRQSLQSTVMIK